MGIKTQSHFLQIRIKMKVTRPTKQLYVLALSLLSIPAWAATVTAPGIRNFHQVNEHIYRGGQPTDEGWNSLAGLGVKTIIDLRREGEDGHSIAAEAQAVEAAGMRYVSVPMEGIVSPGEEQISKILGLMDSEEPVFVHCKEGKDRTGTAIACFRIAHERWENKKAMKEAESHGMHWYEVGMKYYIMNFQPSTERASAGN
jgi:uncharacterized protein (TIGR01244 family)